MQDQFQRQIDYLRISVTDRCNLRCKYCMPAEGVQWMPHESILSFEEILTAYEDKYAIRLSSFSDYRGRALGQERDFKLSARGGPTPGVEDLMLTTNGMLLPEMAFDLKTAGVQRVNISLDTMNPEKFREITRGGDVSRVIQGIFRSLEAGLNPVKINVVVVRGFNEAELPNFLALAKQYPLHIRFIELMPIGISSEHRNDFVPIKEMKELLGIQEYVPTLGIRGGGPAEYFRPSGFKGSIGFISAMSRHFCDKCNRVRLTADGKLRPCLHSKHEVNLREVLRNESSDSDILELFAQAVWHKPAEHHMNDEALQGLRVMSQIGG